MAARAPRPTTPGRRKNVNKENDYFEPGKFGRKTGIELKDTGIRDEYGFEPVSGIFSSPALPSAKPGDRSINATLTSSEMVLQESSAPEPTETLTSRKTPHLPPKSPGPRHTNIGGSPLRYSSVRPASPGKDEPETETPSRALSVGAQRSPNRLLNFAQNDVYRSIERSPSPRKQSAPLETKVKKPRKSIFEFDLSPQKKSVKVRRDEEDKINEAIDEVSDAVEEIVGNGSAEAKEKDSGETLPGAQDEADAPIMDDYVPQMDESMGDAQDYDQTQAEATELSMAQTAADPTPVKRKRGRPRKSDISTPSSRHALSDAATATPQSATRALHQTQLLDETVASLPHQSPAHAHSHLTNGVSKAPHASKPQDYTLQGIAEEDDDEDREVYRETTTADSRAEPDYIPDQEYESSQPAKKKARTSKAKPAAARKAPRAPSAAPSRNSASLGPDGRKPGPKSIVSLRAGTPQEDEGAATTRSGRVSIKPLKYWCNEGFIWRNGEVDGVVRAQEVEQPKKRAGPKARGRQGRSQSAVPGGLESVREAEEEDEDLWPEQWEEELGVINGKVRAWDAEMGQGSLSTEVAEDVAFASTSIAVRDVQGSAFRYAKIMTMPFFGSGMVEIPPGGYKRTKNSRKMQMVFFVHEGKVTVEVAGMTFGLTKGGVWQVPRGNNYSIMNESERHPAKIFFAQGCEVDDAGGLPNGA
ncbi:mitotic fidelity of chromosome transmission-related protein [Zalaria obscura]|uniref:Mitotic fidelity of chromosome transmission-related protein n=1 Tax=Zalaria obscura TaxID=2024903 RepID=A0ACC3S6L2_9PEZI